MFCLREALLRPRRTMTYCMIAYITLVFTSTHGSAVKRRLLLWGLLTFRTVNILAGDCPVGGAFTVSGRSLGRVRRHAPCSGRCHGLYIAAETRHGPATVDRDYFIALPRVRSQRAPCCKIAGCVSAKFCDKALTTNKPLIRFVYPYDVCQRSGTSRLNLNVIQDCAVHGNECCLGSRNNCVCLYAHSVSVV